MNLAMATLGLKEMEKFLWEGREKGLPSLVLTNWNKQQDRPFSRTFQRNLPISFKSKLGIAEFFWKMQRKTWYFILRVDAMPLFLKNLLLSFILNTYQIFITFRCWRRRFESMIISRRINVNQKFHFIYIRTFYLADLLTHMPKIESYLPKWMLLELLDRKKIPKLTAPKNVY